MARLLCQRRSRLLHDGLSCAQCSCAYSARGWPNTASIGAVLDQPLTLSIWQRRSKDRCKASGRRSTWCASSCHCFCLLGEKCSSNQKGQKYDNAWIRQSFPVAMATGNVNAAPMVTAAGGATNAYGGYGHNLRNYANSGINGGP